MNSSTAGVNYDVLAGFVIAAHGVQGAVKIRLATKTALTLISTGEGGSRRPVDVWIGEQPSVAADAAHGLGRNATITQIKELNSGGIVYLAKMQGVTDRNEAETLIGLSVFAPESRRAPLQEDEYFTEDLIGLQVIGDTGIDYGKIVAVLPQPANDVYETDKGALIPAVKAFVQKIDVAGGLVAVVDVPGLKPEEAEEVLPDPSSCNEEVEGDDR